PILAMIIMAFIQFPADPMQGKQREPGRSAAELLKQPVFLVATLGAAVGYGVMNLLMAATPLAMQVYEFEFSATATVLQWHVIGMYAPGFFTGHLIKHFGALKIMGTGVVINVLCIVIAMAGATFTHFLIALTLLGVGWNFLFTGSTALALHAYRPEEKDRAQGIINFWMFLTMAVTSFASGAVVTLGGWTWLNMGSIPFLLTLAFALAWLGIRQRSLA